MKTNDITYGGNVDCEEEKRLQHEPRGPPICRQVSEEREPKMRLKQLSMELEGKARSVVSSVVLKKRFQ